MISVGWSDPNETTFVWQVHDTWTLAEYRAAMSRSVAKLARREQPVALLIDVRRSNPPSLATLRPIAEQRFSPKPPTHLLDRVVVLGQRATWQNLLSLLEHTYGPLPFALHLVESRDAARQVLGTANV